MISPQFGGQVAGRCNARNSEIQSERVWKLKNLRAPTGGSVIEVESGTFADFVVGIGGRIPDLDGVDTTWFVRLWYRAAVETTRHISGEKH